MRDITQRLLDALESEHELAENWREAHRTEAPARGITTLIAEARAALAAQTVSDDAWLVEARKLVKQYRAALFEMSDTESPEFMRTAGEAVAVQTALLAHLRTRPAPEGMELVPVEPSDAILRPFYECPPAELKLAWQAALTIAKVATVQEGAKS
jgi:hypothetical protein